MIAMALMCEPGAAHRRRADHRARRHHPGADPAAAGRPAARARHRDPADHARPRRGRARRRPGRRDVCRARSSRAARRRDLFADPRHPYTRGLLACMPVPGATRAGRAARRHSGRRAVADRRACAAAPSATAAPVAVPACAGDVAVSAGDAGPPLALRARDGRRRRPA